jgi:hypothetical protein
MRRKIAPRQGRCSRAERDARVGALQLAVAGGEAPHAAVKRLAKTWGLEGRRSRSRYLELCLASMWRSAAIGRRGSLAVAIGRREFVYRRAIGLDDMAGANRALEAIERLLGISGDPLDMVALNKPIAKVFEVIREEVGDNDARRRIAIRLQRIWSDVPDSDEPADDNDGRLGRNGTAH